jgi:hypothetical protein
MEKQEGQTHFLKLSLAAFVRLASATRPSQESKTRLTPVGFATPARAECAFIG